jgi:hypothetical protein
MRSVLVFRALAQVSNRYRLCKIATTATRKFHRPNSRLQDTINEVLISFHQTNPQAEAANEGSPGYVAERRRRLTGADEAELQHVFVQTGSEAS